MGSERPLGSDTIPAPTRRECHPTSPRSSFLICRVGRLLATWQVCQEDLGYKCMDGARGKRPTRVG